MGSPNIGHGGDENFVHCLTVSLVEYKLWTVNGREQAVFLL